MREYKRRTTYKNFMNYFVFSAAMPTGTGADALVTRNHKQ
ncbi:hypothetical protein ABIB73_004163 [Bradyrhizobium sp. F1.4.3]